ncbi:carbon-nitrogen hydrolase family protein [Pseudomonas sp. dw_358]|uniref:carbon-nitrogen hydrolase family protein n=1 Tax=Pseudomonas sp. dw_358 TaxID=2720083 RepID=UPI001BD5F3B1|nr:carbon-nitrogen hydrolase family protein [Pseudomonas sp. dw_358]
MSTLTLAAAQLCCVAGDLEANLQRHLQFMEVAARHEVGFLLFPELSLTGYEPQWAHELALTSESPVLAPLRRAAEQWRMTTVVGLPVRLPGNDEVLIGALVLGAEGQVALYTKQHLHPGEERVFTPGQGGAQIRLNEQSIALAVCADFARPEHVEHAAATGATLYAASALISENGYAHDSDLLQRYAREQHLTVLMANHGGVSGGWACAGRSAIWAAGGAQVVAAPGPGDCLVLAQGAGRDWQGWVVLLQGE